MRHEKLIIIIIFFFLLLIFSQKLINMSTVKVYIYEIDIDRNVLLCIDLTVGWETMEIKSFCYNMMIDVLIMIW